MNSPCARIQAQEGGHVRGEDCAEYGNGPCRRDTPRVHATAMNQVGGEGVDNEYLRYQYRIAVCRYIHASFCTVHTVCSGFTHMAMDGLAPPIAFLTD